MDKLAAKCKELNIPPELFYQTRRDCKAARVVVKALAASLEQDLNNISDVLTDKEAKELRRVAESMLLDAIVGELI